MGTGPSQGRPGKDEAENRPGAGRPEQSSTNAQQEGVENALICIGVAGEAVTKLDERTGDALRKRREKQGKAKDGKEHQRGDPAELIRSYRPASTDGRQAGYQGKGDRHSGKQRQAALAKRLIGAGKHEWQHGQDAGAENSEHATEIRQEQQEHLLTKFFPAPAQGRGSWAQMRLQNAQRSYGREGISVFRGNPCIGCGPDSRGARSGQWWGAEKVAAG